MYIPSPHTTTYTDSPFTVEHLVETGFSDPGIVTLEPLVLLLSDVACVMAVVKRATVVHHSKQRVSDTGGGRKGIMMTDIKFLRQLINPQTTLLESGTKYSYGFKTVFFGEAESLLCKMFLGGAYNRV